MIIYHYDRDTREYLNASAAFESPLEPGVFLIPAHATNIEPPKDIPENKIPVMREYSWELVDDYRGQTWWKDHATSVTITGLGDPKVMGLSQTQPKKPDPTMEEYQQAVEAFIEKTAQDKRYTSSATLISYVNSTNPDWKREAMTFIEWRDRVWRDTFILMSNIRDGVVAPLTIEAFINNIRKIAW